MCWRDDGVRPLAAGLALVCVALLAGAVSAAAALPAATVPAEPDRLRLVPLKQVTLHDGFWAPKLRVYKDRTIPHSWQYVDGEVRALRRAAGQRVEGDPNGTWGEANLYKFLETVAYALAQFPDPELERRADEVIALVAKAQRPDGYVHAYITNAGKPPWDPAFLDGAHDGYVLGHLIQAALEYHAATGKRQFLDVACRAADQAYTHFLGPQGQPGFCGHAELEMALVELYRVVPEPRYLALARAFIEWRGRHTVKPFGATPRAYFQDGAPFREQATLEGHAVRAVFFATGVADVALATGDPDYRLATQRFWDSTARRRLAVTGSIGPRAEHEALGEDYELPLDGYYESCAACGLADFAQRVFLLERQAHSADVLERVLYNAILHGIALDGTSTYYRNPLHDRDHLRDNCWVCCPPNLSRTLLQIGRYAYAYRAGEVYVNLYLGGTVRLPLASGILALEVETEYPWDGRVKLTLTPAAASRCALHLRLPGWCAAARLALNGQPVTPLPRTDAGYLRLERTWQPGDTVELELDLPVQRLEAHPNVRACAGRVALQRGPLVYGFEGLDQPGPTDLALGADPGFRVEPRPDLLGGVRVITGKTAGGQPFLAVPFYALANRGQSTQTLWVPQRGLKPSPEWWGGQLYRPLPPERLGE